jgi:hypothetical protein
MGAGSRRSSRRASRADGQQQQSSWAASYRRPTPSQYACGVHTHHLTLHLSSLPSSTSPTIVGQRIGAPGAHDVGSAVRGAERGPQGSGPAERGGLPFRATRVGHVWQAIQTCFCAGRARPTTVALPARHHALPRRPSAQPTNLATIPPAQRDQLRLKQPPHPFSQYRPATFSRDMSLPRTTHNRTAQSMYRSVRAQ